MQINTEVLCKSTTLKTMTTSYAVSRKNALIAESKTTERRYIRFIIRTRLMMQPNLRNSLCSVIAETTATQIPPELYAGMGSALWEQERTTLIKKECHKYDEEWRMITGCIMKPPVMMEWIPSGIILGLRMGVAEENLVVSMAKEAGIFRCKPNITFINPT